MTPWWGVGESDRTRSLEPGRTRWVLGHPFNSRCPGSIGVAALGVSFGAPLTSKCPHANGSQGFHSSPHPKDLKAKHILWLSPTQMPLWMPGACAQTMWVFPGQSCVSQRGSSLPSLAPPASSPSESCPAVCSSCLSPAHRAPSCACRPYPTQASPIRKGDPQHCSHSLDPTQESQPPLFTPQITGAYQDLQV